MIRPQYADDSDPVAASGVLAFDSKNAGKRMGHGERHHPVRR